ncbi:MAG: NAD(P)-binding protein [Mycobacterium sp.]|nr:NAD(P)-binding protein [Mycobacterium sp.]
MPRPSLWVGCKSAYILSTGICDLGTALRSETVGSIRVAIVGGGIGGLSAALALTSVGVDVKVYEQAPALGELGAGIGLFPNSVRVLRRAGCCRSSGRARGSD